MMSPGSRSGGDVGSRTIRALPVTTPGQPAVPLSTSPSMRLLSTAGVFLSHSVSGGIIPSRRKNGGVRFQRLNQFSYRSRRSAE